MPDNASHLIKHIYDCFNVRDIDGVLAMLADNIAWANGMDGGHVHGHRALRDYWTRQWAVVSPHVEPVTVLSADDSVISVEVIQTVTDLDGRPLEGQSHGLKDKTVVHVFHLEGDRITRFDIRNGE